MGTLKDRLYVNVIKRISSTFREVGADMRPEDFLKLPLCEQRRYVERVYGQRLTYF